MQPPQKLVRMLPLSKIRRVTVPGSGCCCMLIISARNGLAHANVQFPPGSKIANLTRVVRCYIAALHLCQDKDGSHHAKASINVNYSHNIAHNNRGRLHCMCLRWSDLFIRVLFKQTRTPRGLDRQDKQEDRVQRGGLIKNAGPLVIKHDSTATGTMDRLQNPGHMNR